MEQKNTTAAKPKKKTVYGLRTRFADTDPWSETMWYKTKGPRDRVASMNRIIGGIRTHSFQEKKPIEEIEDIMFD